MSQSLYNDILHFKQQHGHSLPDGRKARAWVRRLFEILFIADNPPFDSGFEIEIELNKLRVELRQILLPLGYSNETAKESADAFFEALDGIYRNLLLDANAIFEADPAAKDIGEILVAYPGFFAIAVHRFAHQLYKQQIPLLPRILGEYVHGYAGIDIHPGAAIGHSFVIDHGTGVVIGETSVIGNNVKIFQGVTLGALSVQKDKASQKRHPTIEDNVVIYAGATILGGDTVVGHDSIIGGNVWLTRSIQPFSVVFHEAKVTIQDKKSFNEPYNFFI
jgi:serine O-acetyltransferase